MKGRAPKALAPIEFLFAGYVCFRFPQASNRQISEILHGMEARVRGEHADVSMNTRVERTVRNYIKDMEAQYPSLLSADRTSNSKAKKRRRELAIENEDEQTGTPAREII